MNNHYWTYLLLALCYLAPTALAHTVQRRKVFVVNIFLGWTFIGYIFAMLMGMRSNDMQYESEDNKDA